MWNDRLSSDPLAARRALACAVWLALGGWGVLIAALVGMWVSPGLSTLLWSGVAAGWLAVLRRWHVVTGPIPLRRVWAQAQLVVASTVVLYFGGPPADLNARFRLHWIGACAFVGVATAALAWRTATDRQDRAPEAKPGRSERASYAPWLAAAGWLVLAGVGGMVVTMLTAVLSPGVALLSWTAPAFAYHEWLASHERSRRPTLFVPALYAVQVCGALSAVPYFVLSGAQRETSLEPLWRGTLAAIAVLSAYRAWVSATARARTFAAADNPEPSAP